MASVDAPLVAGVGGHAGVASEPHNGQPAGMSPVVKAEIKGILYFGPGASNDAARFDPADPAHFSVSVQALIGQVGDHLADSFDVRVCSPGWFSAEVANGVEFKQGAPLGLPGAIALGAGLWFMQRWDQDEFESAVRFLCETYSPAPDWGSLASRIGRQMPWEYDYRYDDHVDSMFGSPFPPPRAV